MSNGSPKVSVIIPAYNSAKYIIAALDSIKSQTYQDIECIVIDDCSTDETWELIQSAVKNDKRIKAYSNSKNIGIGGNRRYGIELARGEFICWQDADDLSTPTRIEKQVEFLLKNPEVGAVGGFLKFFGEGIKESTRKYAEDDKQLRRCIFRFNPIAQPAAMVRSECFKSVGTYDTRYHVSEDLEMFFRIGTKYKFGNIQEIAVLYRQHSGSLTASKLRSMELATLKLRWKYSKHHAYNPMLGDYIYNIAQFVSIYLLPGKLKITLFNKLRNS